MARRRRERMSEGKKNIITYRCGTYSNHGKNVCTSHNIREEVLEAIVLNDIRHYYGCFRAKKKLWSLSKMTIKLWRRKRDFFKYTFWTMVYRIIVNLFLYVSAAIGNTPDLPIYAHIYS